MTNSNDTKREIDFNAAANKAAHKYFEDLGIKNDGNKIYDFVKAWGLARTHILTEARKLTRNGHFNELLSDGSLRMQREPQKILAFFHLESICGVKDE